MTHLHSLEATFKREKKRKEDWDVKREQKRTGWTFIHNSRTEPDGHIYNNSWHDTIIGETVDIVDSEIVIEHLETKFPMQVLPSVRQYFRENAPRGLVIQAQFKV